MSQAVSGRAPPKRRDWSWRSQAFRGLVYQIIAIALVAFGVWFLAHNTLENMRVRGIQSGFGFLTQPAGFDIGETLFNYDALDAYWIAFLVGIANTLRVAIIGVVLTTVLGALLGIGRFSRNALVRGLCYGYVELFRNIPVLLQLLMWYLVFTELLPDPFDPVSAFGLVFLSKGGFQYPVPVWGLGQGLAVVGALVGIGLAWLYRRWARQAFERTGHVRSMFWVPLAIVIATAVVGWLVGGAPTAWNIPHHGEGMVEGGSAVTPEFMAVLLGLVFYTSAFVAEVVRAGIQSVSHVQIEAASSLGLSRGHSMRLVILPQAMRVIIPPMTNQYLNLTKNSSLAVAIGYPDVVSIANTAINQTGRAVECIAIIMAVYLTTSLTTSAIMNWYNKRSAIKER
ncbi:MAG TPA: ABC transporter permease subunit [Burkholderiaceae bacterium]|nr:ABC transporter permease subunit [Burkholderiaceae bacterium]